MYIKIVDGKPIFALHLINVNIDEETKRKLSFRIEDNKIICYSDFELSEIENELNELNIFYTIEPIAFSDEQKQKVINKKFNSRTEAIKYLNGEIEEPESEIIPRLKREKAELEMAIAAILGGAV